MEEHGDHSILELGIGPDVDLYASFYKDGNPATPCNTRLITTRRGREEILFACSTVFQPWDHTSDYIIKQPVPFLPNVFVDVDDFGALKAHDQVFIYRVPGGPIMPHQREAERVPEDRAHQEMVNGDGENNRRQDEDQNRNDFNDAMDDVEEEEEDEIDVRANAVGRMPTLYKIPDFEPELVTLINDFGRRVDPATRKKIADLIRNDMLKYASYAYPTLPERARAAERLLIQYPTLADSERVTGTHKNQWSTWVVEISRSFHRWRRTNSKRCPLLAALRRKRLIATGNTPAHRGSRAYNPNLRAERRCQDIIKSIGDEQIEELDGDELQEVLRLRMLDLWNADPPTDRNLIVDLMNRTTTIRRAFVTNPANTLAMSLEMYPPLKQAEHVRDDVIRYFHVDIPAKLKAYFTLPVCTAVYATICLNKHTPADLLNSFVRIEGNMTEEKVLRDFVLAALPSLGGKDYTSAWYSVGKQPQTASPVVRIDSNSLMWADYRQSTYSVIADGQTIKPGGDGEFTFADAIAVSLGLFYLCGMKLPRNAYGAARFLAEDVCQLPSDYRSKNHAQLTLLSIFSQD